MAKQANRMMIGGFVVMAVFLLAASLVVFGSGKFFQKTNKYVLYFNESIKGLSVGAPVLFQGVQVGSVISITIQADLAEMHTQIPVVIAIEPDRFHVRAGKRDYREVAAKLIEKGLRAELVMQSFITGQLMIGLDFNTDTGMCYLPGQIDPNYKDYIVIPTCPSTTARLAQALEKVDIGALQKKLEAGLDGIDKLVNNPDLTASIRDLKDTLQDARKLITKLNRQVDPLAKDVKKTVNDFGKLAKEFDPRMKELTTSVEKTLSSLDKTLSAARGVVSPDAPLVVDLEGTLKELSATSRSIRELTDYLDQHPASLIFGKKKPGGKEPCN
jgi:paraquat-inducible protein B